MEDAASTMVPYEEMINIGFGQSYMARILLFARYTEHWANICIFQLRGYWMISDMKIVFHNLTLFLRDSA